MGLLNKLRGKQTGADMPTALGATSTADDEWYMTYEVSDMELDGWTSEMAWGITAFVREEIDNAQSRDKYRVLIICTAHGCAGCETLMTQLNDERYMIEDATHVVRAIVGEFPARWFARILMGDTLLHLPGLPTAFMCTIPDAGSEELTITALSLGPMNPGNVTEDLVDGLLKLRSRYADEAREATIAIDQGGTRHEFSPAGQFDIDLTVTLTAEGSPDSISPVMAPTP